MQYRVFVSDGHDHNSFYIENEPQANLLFNMAVNSKMFTYVELSEVREELFMKKEWAEDDEEE